MPISKLPNHFTTNSVFTGRVSYKVVLLILVLIRSEPNGEEGVSADDRAFVPFVAPDVNRHHDIPEAQIEIVKHRHPQTHRQRNKKRNSSSNKSNVFRFHTSVLSGRAQMKCTQPVLDLHCPQDSPPLSRSVPPASKAYHEGVGHLFSMICVLKRLICCFCLFSRLYLPRAYDYFKLSSELVVSSCVCDTTNLQLLSI